MGSLTVDPGLDSAPSEFSHCSTSPAKRWEGDRPPKAGGGGGEPGQKFIATLAGRPTEYSSRPKS
jgi:hypothetical protein